MFSPIVIVGAGQAAAQAVETLRKRGHVGPLRLIGDEDLLPYQRPPLSKKYLAGSARCRPIADPPRRSLPRAWRGPAPRLRGRQPRSRATTPRSRRRIARRIRPAAARHRQPAAIAAGPVWNSVGSYYLRTAADVERLRAEFGRGRRAVIIGGGYIGLEVAATCREAGLDVTVVEAAERVMSRVVVTGRVAVLRGRACAPRRARSFADARVPELAAAMDGQRRHATRIAAVRPDRRPRNSRRISSLVAIGVVPVDSLARDAGLHCDDGIVVDRVLPHLGPAHLDGRRLRAAIRACTTAHACASSRWTTPSSRAPAPRSTCSDSLPCTTRCRGSGPISTISRWSSSGSAIGHDQIVVVRGDPASRAFSVCYLRGGELIAVETVNHTKDQMAARKLIPARARPDPRSPGA